MRNPTQNIPLSLFIFFLIGFCSLLIGYSGFSQVTFGVKSGMNIATTKDLIEFPKNRIGWYAGAFMEVPFDKKVFLLTEVLYSSKGDDVNQLNVSKGVLRFNYLDLPILFGYNIDRRTALVLGPEFGYLLSANAAYNNNENFDVSKNYDPKYDIGLDIGLKYNAIKNITIEVRYNYGLKMIYYTDYAGVPHKETKGANRVFQIGLNYIFKKNHTKKF